MGDRIVYTLKQKDGNGLSLYNGAVSGKPDYGIMFAGTATFGTHGGVTSDQWSAEV